MISTGPAGVRHGVSLPEDRSSRSAGPREPNNQSRAHSVPDGHGIAMPVAPAFPGQGGCAQGRTTGGSDGRVYC